MDPYLHLTVKNARLDPPDWQLPVIDRRRLLDPKEKCLIAERGPDCLHSWTQWGLPDNYRTNKTMRPLHVLHVAAPLSAPTPGIALTGGLDRFLDELIPLQRELYEVTVLCPPATDLARLNKAIRGSKFHRASTLGLTLLNDRHYDIVHLHDWYGGALIDGLYSLKARRIVLTIHLPLRCGFTYRDIDLDTYEKILLEQRAISSAQVIVSPSQFLSAFLQAEYGVHSKNIRVLPHGVNTSTFYNVSGFRNPKKLLIVGRLADQKGIPLVVRALPHLLGLSPDFSLTIVGSGGQEMNLRELITRMRLEKVVKLLPAAGPEFLRQEYSSAGLLLIPSYFEPFGLVGLEAMACGCPVLALSPNGVSEYLMPSEMFTDLSPQRIADQILQQVTNGKIKNRQTQTLRERALEWTWKKTAEGYDKIYRNVLDE